MYGLVYIPFQTNGKRVGVPAEAWDACLIEVIQKFIN
jgi:hypothetical protein